MTFHFHIFCELLIFLCICIGRDRSKFLNLCPIPIALYCNKNMFKSNIRLPYEATEWSLYTTTATTTRRHILCQNSHFPSSAGKPREVAIEISSQAYDDVF